MKRIDLPYENIPESVFIKAIQVREIVKARALSVAERNMREANAPDIEIKPIIGVDTFLSKEQVANMYSYSNGTGIKFSGWKSTKNYILMRDHNSIVYVMKVPKQHSVRVGTTVANEKRAGDYIVCQQDRSGLPDKSTGKVVSAALFKKMCYIPVQDEITRNIGRDVGTPDFSQFKSTVNHDFYGDTGFIENAGVTYERPYQPVNPANTSGSFDEPMESRIERPVAKPVQSKPAAQGNSSDTQYTLVYQLLNDCGQRVGFVIRSKSGAEKNIDKQTAVKLCTSKKISNADAVRGPSGEFYIRGNGMKLDDLPTLNI